MTNKPPVHQVRLGRIIGKMWENQSDDKKWYNVTLGRLYKDGDEWKSSSSFGLGDMPQAIEVLRLAMDYVAGQEAEVG